MKPESDRLAWPSSPAASVRTLPGALILLTALLLAGGPDARAAQDETYLFGSVSYMPVSSSIGYLHCGALGLGSGYFISDFAVVDGQLYYAGTYADDAFRHFIGLDAAFRLLIDVTEWVPSIGPAGGISMAWSEPGGLSAVFHVGISVCVEHRTQRDHSMALCGEIQAVPLHTDFQAMYLLSFRFNGFLPYFFE